jgi:hypothetical protein
MHLRRHGASDSEGMKQELKNPRYGTRTLMSSSGVIHYM